jgi:adenine-specific DNA-methyltransferase
MNLQIRAYVSQMPPTIKMKNKHAQYFTTHEVLQQTVFDFVRNRGETLLEPSFGAGHLLCKFLELDPHYPMQLFEIDESIPPIIHISPEHQQITYCDFMSVSPPQPPPRTIVGNPPYMKCKGSRNLYIDFVEKCFHLLDPNCGEMVFIIPSEFFKQTRAAGLITDMWEAGAFTDFLFPNDETMFDNASVDVVVFRYVKGVNQQDLVAVNGGHKRISFSNGIITLNTDEDDIPRKTIGETCDVFVGIVSGRDEVYRNETHGNVEVLTDKDTIHKFVLIDKFPSDSRERDEYLESHKSKLMDRRIRKFNEKNWFEWGALRNIDKMRNMCGRECVYVRTVTRKDIVAFKGRVQYFGGSLICIVPTEATEIDAIVKTLNSPEYRENYTYSGRFKIGQKQVSISKYRDTCLTLKCI